MSLETIYEPEFGIRNLSQVTGTFRTFLSQICLEMRTKSSL
jgi:hypothetical protein